MLTIVLGTPGSAKTAIATRLRRALSLDAMLVEARQEHAAAAGEADRARARIGAPFEHEDALRRLQRRQQEINDQLLPPERTAPAEQPPEQRMATRLAFAGRAESARPPSPVRR